MRESLASRDGAVVLEGERLIHLSTCEAAAPTTDRDRIVGAGERCGWSSGSPAKPLGQHMLTQRMSASLRVKMPEPMEAQEIDREARALWENIAEEYGDRRGLAGIIARTYLLARDLQRFAEGGRVRWDTLLSVPRFLYNVIAQSRGMALAS